MSHKVTTPFTKDTKNGKQTNTVFKHIVISAEQCKVQTGKNCKELRAIKIAFVHCICTFRWELYWSTMYSTVYFEGPVFGGSVPSVWSLQETIRIQECKLVPGGRGYNSSKNKHKKRNIFSDLDKMVSKPGGARLGPTKISTTKQTNQVVCECQNI